MKILKKLSNRSLSFFVQGYDSFTPVTRVIDGGEPMEFRCLFKHWREKDQTTTMMTMTKNRRISGEKKKEKVIIGWKSNFMIFMKLALMLILNSSPFESPIWGPIL